MLQGQVITGVRLAEASGRPLPPSGDGDSDGEAQDTKKKKKHQPAIQSSTLDSKRRHQYLAEILKWRAATTPDHVLFSQVNSKVRALSLYK